MESDFQRDSPSPFQPSAFKGHPLDHRAIPQAVPLAAQIGNRSFSRVVEPLVAVRFGEQPAVQRLMANVEFDDSPTPGGPLVDEVAIERGSGTSGGAHATAHAVFEWQAVHAVHRKNFNQARQGLLDLCTAALSLPNYGSSASAAGEIAAMRAKPDYQPATAVGPHKWAQVLQTFIVDYLRMRNEISGTYVTGKSGTKGIGDKQEKRGIASMRSVYADLSDAAAKDPGGKATKAFSAGMHLTHDDDAYPPKSSMYSWPDIADLATIPLAQHIMSCMTAFPEIVAAKKSAIQKNYVNELAKSVYPAMPKKVVDRLLTQVATATGI